MFQHQWQRTLDILSTFSHKKATHSLPFWQSMGCLLWVSQPEFPASACNKITSIAYFMLENRSILVLQSSAIIMWANITCYGVQYYCKWDRTINEIFKSQKTPHMSYLSLVDELWGVCCEDLGENWSHSEHCRVFAVHWAISPSHTYTKFWDPALKLLWSNLETGP